MLLGNTFFWHNFCHPYVNNIDKYCDQNLIHIEIKTVFSMGHQLSVRHFYYVSKTLLFLPKNHASNSGENDFTVRFVYEMIHIGYEL